MIFIISILSLMFLLLIVNQGAVGQEENVTNGISSIFSNESTADQIIRSLEILIEQNEDSSRNAVLSSYIAMMAFLVGLSVVIFGLQLSRGEKITPTAKKYYRILILVLVLPVISLYVYAFVTFEVVSDYLGVATLLMIPAGAVLILMGSRSLYEKL